MAAGQLAAGAVDQGQQRSPKPTFDVKYKSGLFDCKSGTWFKVAFVTTGSHQGSTKPLLSITDEQITAVQFSAKTEKDSHLLEQMSRSGCAYVRSMLPESGAQPDRRALIVFLASPGAGWLWSESMASMVRIMMRVPLGTFTVSLVRDVVSVGFGSGCGALGGSWDSALGYTRLASSKLTETTSARA